jgi:hypothetical protein
MTQSGRPAQMTSRAGTAHDHHQIRKLEVQYIMEPRKGLHPLNATQKFG